MELNSITLTPGLIEDLYGKSLVYPGEKWKSLGNNQKHVLIIVNNPDQYFLTEQELKFLTTILAACQLSMDDVAIVNLSKQEQAVYKELIAYFKSRIVLLFDLQPSVFGLPMNFPYYQIQPFAGSSFLYAPSLDTLEKEIEEKKKLWSSLKRLFNI